MRSAGEDSSLRDTKGELRCSIIGSVSYLVSYSATIIQPKDRNNQVDVKPHIEEKEMDKVIQN